MAEWPDKFHRGDVPPNWDYHKTLDLDESEEEIVDGAAVLGGWVLHNANAATLYLKFYNANASDTTVGTTTPVITVAMASGQSANFEMTHGIRFGTGLTVAVTTGVADADTGAPSANDFIATILYKAL